MAQLSFTVEGKELCKRVREFITAKKLSGIKFYEHGYEYHGFVVRTFIVKGSLNDIKKSFGMEDFSSVSFQIGLEA